jgi:hypothetical protein
MWMLAFAILAGLPAQIALSGTNDEVVLKKDEFQEVATMEDDDDDGDTSNSNSGFTSGVDSNDRTGSGHTPVSRDRDRSRGDKTRDRTRDGKGGVKRDWSGGHTNDRSRNDSR